MARNTGPIVRSGAGSDSLGCLGSLFVIALLVWLVLPSKWADPVRYSTQFGIPSDRVRWTDEPTDCDWTRAPLGAKGCHYKKVVQGFNAAGELVAGDDAPVYGHDDKTGKPIFSYDGGKTWNWVLPTYDAKGNPVTPEIDLKVRSVVISWVKVTE